jgi:predicted DNA-binding transcriptional regulator AlpA
VALSHDYQAVANGLRTDHPIPDLPFVDDTHLSLDDPDAIEAIGRKPGGKTWGRTDPCKDGGWVAFTTDPVRQDLAWVVRWHPEHGRSVVVYRDADASAAYMSYGEEALLFRAGGYWFDGSTWYRPSQVFDLAREVYVNRPVPAALTITAADLLDGDATRGAVMPIGDITIDADGNRPARTGRWRDDLALWAARRDGGRHLAGCVVQLTAPELTAEQLLSVAELAEVAGVGASTLRAYLARGEGDVPAPQAIVGGRSMWSRPVAEEWAEQRRRSRDGIAETMADPDHTNLSVGVTELWKWFARVFTGTLWENPAMRKRFALRWRTEAAVRTVAHDMAWTVAGSLNKIVPMDDLSETIRTAVLYELLDWKQTYGAQEGEHGSYPIARQVAKMLDWLIRHQPTQAHRTVAEIIGEAERKYGIPPQITGNSLHTALGLDGKLNGAAYAKFLATALPPTES